MKLTEAFEVFDTARFGLVSEKTRSSYAERWAALVKFLGDMDINDVTLDHLRRYSRFLYERRVKFENHPCRPAEHAPLSPTTIHSMLKGVRRVFNWFEGEGIIAVNPTTRLEIPRRPDFHPRAATVEDVRAIIAEARRSLMPERDTSMVMLLADSGCRSGGLVNLRLDDLDILNHRARILEKDRRWRYIFFGELTARALQSWLDVRPVVASDRLFISLCPWHPAGGTRCTTCQKRGDRLRSQAVGLLLKRLGKRAGVSGRCNPHSLRHLAAMQWLRSGGDLSRVSRLLGHSEVTITAMFYLRWTDDELQQFHETVSYVGNAIAEKE